MANMDESQTWRTSKRYNHRVSDTVQAGMSSRQGLVDLVAGIEILMIIGSLIPSYASQFRPVTVDLPNSGSFTSAQLLHGTRADILVEEAHLVHSPRE